MSTVNIPIPSLINGVSQQAASVRSTSQLAEQLNAWSSIVDGLTKRPPTEHIAKLASYPGSPSMSSALVHTINRDSSNQFLLILTGSTLLVYNLLTGQQIGVSMPDGAAYLNASNPSAQFSVITIADYTFIVNKTVTVNTEVFGGPAINGTVQTMEKLPTSPTVGHIYKVTGSANNPFDNFYVQYNGSAWVEVVNPPDNASYLATTMPHVLVRDAQTGVWTFKKATWNTRITGDAQSSPYAGFHGRKITEILFHRNRLGLVADESVNLSRAAGFFNFFRSTATAVLDTDPIFTAVSHTKVSIIRHAVPFEKQLLLFSDQTQFALTARDTLKPGSSAIDVTTEFDCSPVARPVASGPNLFFAADVGEGSIVREYFIQEDTISNDAADVTAHCPTYVPSGAFMMAANSTHDCVSLITTSKRNAVYVYKFYWRDDEKVQSAWGRWEFQPGDSILSIASITTYLYLVTERSDGVYLERINLQQRLVDTGLPFRVSLDRRVLLTGSYDSGTDTTTWTLPYAETADLQVVLSADFPTEKGSVLKFTRPTSTTVAATGDYSGGGAYIGVKYTTRVRLSEPFMRDEQDIAILDGRLQLKRLMVRYTNSGSFRIEVTPKARPTSTYYFNGKVLGDSNFIIGQPSVASGVAAVPIMSKSDRVVVELVNDSYLPSSFQSADWIAEFTPKSKRK